MTNQNPCYVNYNQYKNTDWCQFTLRINRQPQSQEKSNLQHSAVTINYTKKLSVYIRDLAGIDR